MASGTINKYADGQDSGWLVWQGTEDNDENFIGNIRYRKIGLLVEIMISVTPKEEITSGFFSPGNLPDGWVKPATPGWHALFTARFSVNNGAENYTGVGLVFTNTTGIRIYKPDALSTIATTTGMSGNCMYFTAS